MAARVFISYSSADEKEAKKFAKCFDDLNVDYFLDCKDIAWGDDVTEEIKSGLSECTALVVIVSPASIKSQWVPYEIGHASALGKKILPFLTHPSLDVPGYLQKLHYKTHFQDVKSYFRSLLTTETEIVLQASGSKISPKERDHIRSERNDILTAQIERQNGVSDCTVFQLDDHTDNGYLLGVTFDGDTTSAAELVSVIRSSLNELFPDIPIWGEMKTESDHSVGFAYTYIDAYNKRFTSSHKKA